MNEIRIGCWDTYKLVPSTAAPLIRRRTASEKNEDTLRQARSVNPCLTPHCERTKKLMFPGLIDRACKIWKESEFGSGFIRSDCSFVSCDELCEESFKEYELNVYLDNCPTKIRKFRPFPKRTVIGSEFIYLRFSRIKFYYSKYSTQNVEDNGQSCHNNVREVQ